MRESFTYGSVGRALRKQCLYPEPARKIMWFYESIVRAQRIDARQVSSGVGKLLIPETQKTRFGWVIMAPLILIIDLRPLLPGFSAFF
jgi:hypothetical protein